MSSYRRQLSTARGVEPEIIRRRHASVVFAAKIFRRFFVRHPSCAWRAFTRFPTMISSAASGNGSIGRISVSDGTTSQLSPTCPDLCVYMARRNRIKTASTEEGSSLFTYSCSLCGCFIPAPAAIRRDLHDENPFYSVISFWALPAQRIRAVLLFRCAFFFFFESTKQASNGGVL